MTQQQTKSKPNKTTAQEWQQQSTEWERRPVLLRRQAEGMEYDDDNPDIYTDLEDQLSSLDGRPTEMSPRITATSMTLYEGSVVQMSELQDNPSRILDYEINCMPGTELPNLFHVGSLSNTPSGSSSDNTSRDYFDMSLMPTIPGLASLPSLSKSLTVDASGIGSSCYSDEIMDTTYDQAFGMSQQIHRQLLGLQSRPVDSTTITNKYASAELCQVLESFDALAKLLKQRIARHKQRRDSGGLPAMIVSGALHVAVLQALLIATVLLQSDGEVQTNDKRTSDNNRSNYQLPYGQQLSSNKDQPMRSSRDIPQDTSNLDAILNLTKMEYYITIFNQYLQIIFRVNDTNTGTQDCSPIFDHKSCIDTTESVQIRVRLLLSQSRQSML
jgi:hypothetical protein